MALPERFILPSHREYLVSELSGRVLDLGAGTGALFPYFADQQARTDNLDVHAIEPDPHMRRQAQEAADELDLDVTIADGRGELLPYEDRSLDAVIASLVFCTIPDPDAALSEVARVLRPGGEFRFLEHVRADGVMGRVHDTLAPVWHVAAGGCHLNRETGNRFQEDDRFALVEFNRYSSPFTPLIRGRLRRRTEPLNIRGTLDRVLRDRN